MSQFLVALLIALACGALVFAIVPGRSRASFNKDAVSRPEALFGAVSRGWFSRWAARYRETGGNFNNPRTPGAVVLGIAAASGATGGLFFFPVGIVLFASVAILISWSFLGAQSKKRSEKVSIQLADFIDSTRSALGRGATMEQAIRQSVPTTEEPLRHDLQGLIDDLNLGRSMTEALRELSRKARSRSMLIACANLAMATASSQAPATDNLRELSKLIRSNNETVRDIRAETLLLRLSKNVFVALPPALLLAAVGVFGLSAFMTPLGFGVIILEIAISVGVAAITTKANSWITKGATL